MLSTGVTCIAWMPSSIMLKETLDLLTSAHQCIHSSAIVSQSFPF
jgi:hypothetical protein